MDDLSERRTPAARFWGGDDCLDEEAEPYTRRAALDDLEREEITAQREEEIGRMREYEHD